MKFQYAFVNNNMTNLLVFSYQVWNRSLSMLILSKKRQMNNVSTVSGLCQKSESCSMIVLVTSVC